MVNLYISKGPPSNVLVLILSVLMLLQLTACLRLLAGKQAMQKKVVRQHEVEKLIRTEEIVLRQQRDSAGLTLSLIAKKICRIRLETWRGDEKFDSVLLPDEFVCGEMPLANKRIVATAKEASVALGNTDEQGRLVLQAVKIEQLLALGSTLELGPDLSGEIVLDLMPEYRQSLAKGCQQGGHEDCRKLVQVDPEGTLKKCLREAKHLLNNEDLFRDPLSIIQQDRINDVFEAFVDQDHIQVCRATLEITKKLPAPPEVWPTKQALSDTSFKKCLKRNSKLRNAAEKKYLQAVTTYQRSCSCKLPSVGQYVTVWEPVGITHLSYDRQVTAVNHSSCHYQVVKHTDYGVRTKWYRASHSNCRKKKPHRGDYERHIRDCLPKTGEEQAIKWLAMFMDRLKSALVP